MSEVLPAAAVFERASNAITGCHALFEAEASKYVVEPSSFGIVRSTLDAQLLTVAQLERYAEQGGGPHGTPERCAELALELAQEAQAMVARTLSWSQNDRFGLADIVVVAGEYIADKAQTAVTAGAAGIGFAVVLLVALYLFAGRRLA